MRHTARLGGFAQALMHRSDIPVVLMYYGIYVPFLRDAAQICWKSREFKPESGWKSGF